MILLASAIIASAQPLPSAREAYVGCYLLTQEVDVPLSDGKSPPKFSALSCFMMLDALARAQQEKTKSERTFCLPSKDSPYKQMASAYVAYYEQAAPVISEKGAMFELLKAVALKWPCFD